MSDPISPASGGSSRWWLVILLCLSLGTNVGIVVTVVGQRVLRSRSPALAPATAAVPGWVAEVPDRLPLDEARRAELRVLHFEFVREGMRRRAEIERLRQLLREELRAERPDEGRVEELVRGLGRAYTGLEGLFARHVIRSRQLLDGEAERRYLDFLSHLGQRATPGAPGVEGSDPRRRFGPLERRPPAGAPPGSKPP